MKAYLKHGITAVVIQKEKEGLETTRLYSVWGKGKGTISIFDKEMIRSSHQNSSDQK